ncbi:hypothetical protein DY000_02024343 [Brassica cretica]|uniref:Uncharacterized protein n=1 Tax=Brassica cretica TaxID=69181 RepID=A0ABQ7EJT8_BRACR|nr:hypothetical protein DY000_02024343 [Brassica cretica]
MAAKRKFRSSLRHSEAPAEVSVYVSSDAGGISSLLLHFTLLLIQFLASPPIYFCFWGRVSSLVRNPLARRSFRWWICFFWTHGEVVGALARMERDGSTLLTGPVAVCDPSQRSSMVLGDSACVLCGVLVKRPFFLLFQAALKFRYLEMRLALTIWRQRWYGGSLSAYECPTISPPGRHLWLLGDLSAALSLLIFSTWFSTGSSIDDGRASGSSLGFIGIFPSTPGVASQVTSTTLRFLEAANGNVIFSGCGWLRRCPIWQCAYPIAKRGRVTSIGSVLAVFVLVVRETGYCTAATTNPSFGVICRVVKLGSSLLFKYGINPFSAWSSSASETMKIASLARSLGTSYFKRRPEKTSEAMRLNPSFRG